MIENTIRIWPINSFVGVIRNLPADTGSATSY
jgi:hypothetical protein